ncbi:hypothetical protein ABFT80_07260 [Mesorhizobium sp. SB112]|uniref:hypothetical protein n=1 Tax=Mesorhizobium sp. SB112 TaxID=3151853 RepID=UPI003264E94B
MAGKKAGQFRHNHYVPEWYQKRFLMPGETRFHHLDLAPEKITVATAKGPKTYSRNEVHEWGPDMCFAEEDLYTTNWAGTANTDIEQFFFGDIDDKGRKAAELFSAFEYDHPGINEGFHHLLRYMSVQKLRTPKGLAFLSAVARTNNKALNLLLLQRIQSMHCAIWTECIWQIADCSQSPTKLIISDHPVTVYNRECFPMSRYCSGSQDPDIRFVATHTYFPLSLDKLLIFTNKSWLRDPYQNALAVRPNPDLFRGAMFSWLDIQTGRKLTEDEVLKVNYITKKRAYRYIAAGKREWLYPERRMKHDHWRKFGDGLLLMPEPRHHHMGGEIIIGYKDGSSDAFGPYGHKPWQKGYKDGNREARESSSLERFKAEWAAKHGPRYTAVDWGFGASRDNPPRSSDSKDFHQHYLEEDAVNLKRPGERARRRRLKE